MPRGQPFTRMCQSLAAVARPAADLHVHTTASDGEWTPSRVVIAAREAGLAAVAITDHDTTAGIDEAKTTAAGLTGRPVEVISAAEVSARWNDRELHVLGCGIDRSHDALQSLLVEIRHRRRKRFVKYLAALADAGVRLTDWRVETLLARGPSLGRRHVARLLVEDSHARTTHDAFRRHLGGVNVPADHSASIGEVVAAIRASGGLPVLAHPHQELTQPELAELASTGIAGVECRFPAATAGRTKQLREWANELGLVTTAGSDFHAPDTGRSVGGIALTTDEFAQFRARAGRSD